MYIKNTTHTYSWNQKMFGGGGRQLKEGRVGGRATIQERGWVLRYGCTHSFSNISQTNEKRSNAAVPLSLTCKSYSGNITFVDKSYKKNRGKREQIKTNRVWKIIGKEESNKLATTRRRLMISSSCRRDNKKMGKINTRTIAIARVEENPNLPSKSNGEKDQKKSQLK